MGRIVATLALVGALLFSAGCAWAEEYSEKDTKDRWIAYQYQDYTTAIRELTPLAQQGDAFAQFNLGLWYDDGDWVAGIPDNDAEAVKWYRKAAEQGLARAQRTLGIMLNEGLGTPENDLEAAKWFHKAAEQGDVHAQLNLGFMYAEGEGVPVNYIKSYMWFSLAKAQGHEWAAVRLDKLKELMTPSQITRAQALVRG